MQLTKLQEELVKLLIFKIKKLKTNGNSRKINKTRRLSFFKL